MSLAEVRAAQCAGKERYAGYAAARKVLDRMNRRARRASKGVNAYRCPHCHGWHIGVKFKGERP